MHAHLVSPIAAFVGNNTWFTILIVLHVMGAIMGLGPSFTFGILGPSAGKQTNPAAALAILQMMVKIENALVLPILLVVQLTSGALLIFNRGLNVGFFTGGRAWLVAGIGVYVVAMIISIGVNMPTLHRMVHIGETGQGLEQMPVLAKRAQMFGIILTVLAIAIMVLMIWKPGSACSPLAC